MLRIKIVQNILELFLKKIIKSLLIIAPLFWVDLSRAQSLKEQLEAQKKYDLLEEMRKKDEKEIAEFEKSKNSIPRNKLSEAGTRLICDDRGTMAAGASAEELSALSNIKSFFRITVMADNNLYSVRQCSSRNREERFCATKIGQVIVNTNSIEYSLKNNINRKEFDFQYGEIKDWLFDGSKNTLILKYGRSNKLYEIPCSKALWLDD